MEIILRIVLGTETALLGAELIDVLRDVQKTLSRIGWNELARRDAGASPAVPVSAAADPPVVVAPVAPGPVVPAAVAPLAPVGEVGKWSDARERLGCELWANGIRPVSIARELSRLPGRVLSASAVKHYASRRQWHREVVVGRGTEGAKQSRERLAAFHARDPKDQRLSTAAREIALAEQEAQTAPLPMADALTWAARNGAWRAGQPAPGIDAINMRRRALGLLAFRIIPARGRPDPLPEPHVGGAVEARP